MDGTETRAKGFSTLPGFTSPLYSPAFDAVSKSRVEDKPASRPLTVVMAGVLECGLRDMVSRDRLADDVLHPLDHGKFVLTDDRSMIDWGAFGAPRRVDCDDLYRQPQTALQHRRISLCVRPAVREEEVAMVR